MKTDNVVVKLTGDTSQLDESVEQAKRVMRDCETALLRVERAASMTTEKRR